MRFVPLSRENDVDKLRDLGEALAQGADAALVGEVRESCDVQAHVVDSQDVEGAHLLAWHHAAQKNIHQVPRHLVLKREKGGADNRKKAETIITSTGQEHRSQTKTVSPSNARTTHKSLVLLMPWRPLQASNSITFSALMSANKPARSTDTGSLQRTLQTNIGKKSRTVLGGGARIPLK